MANFAELTIDAGTDYNEIITIQDDGTGNLINLTGYSISSQMRRSYYSVNATANFSCTIVDAANGNVSISLSNSITANINPGRYVYDVKAVTPANSVVRLIEGTATVTPRVTH
jgi:hypothetical protein